MHKHMPFSKRAKKEEFILKLKITYRVCYIKNQASINILNKVKNRQKSTKIERDIKIVAKKLLK